MYKKLQNQAFQELGEIWNTLLLNTFAQNLAPSKNFEVVGYTMNLQIAYYHFQSIISHIWH